MSPARLIQISTTDFNSAKTGAARVIRVIVARETVMLMWNVVVPISCAFNVVAAPRMLQCQGATRVSLNQEWVTCAV